MEPHYEKVFFPGESMWVEVESTSPDGDEITGYIRNAPMSHLHEYEQDQKIVCRKNGKWWEPDRAA